MKLKNEMKFPTISTKKDETTYTSDASPSSASNLRPIEIKTTAKAGTGVNIKRTTISYLQRDEMWLPQYKDEFVSGTTTLYRRTEMKYTSKPAQYILGLVEETLTYSAASLTAPIARTKNHYDEAAYLMDATSALVIQHDNDYDSDFLARGNLTSVEQFWGASTTSRFVKRITYDTNGNMRAEIDANGNGRQIDYTDNYSNKPSGVGQTHAYVYTATDPIGFRAGSQWDYFRGQPVKTFNLTPGSSTETQVSPITYDFADCPLRVTRPDGGWTQTDHWDNVLAVAISTNVGGGNVAHKYEQFDGAGRAFKKGSDHPDGVAGKYSGQIIVSDVVGQVKDTSNVLAIDGTWTPAYEDASKSWATQFTHLTRDELSRLKIMTYPDGNTKQITYEGCGCAGNNETRVTDELGQETITKTDFLGRLLEATEPDASVSDQIYSKATYHYDELDRLVVIEHRGRYNGTTGLTPTQYRSFNYDGYGRLLSENTPEGGLVSYTYTANDQVQTVTDPRNISVTNTYNSRTLLTGVSYSDGTPGVSFGYDNFGARTSMTDGEGATTYSYNSFRQLQSETRTFTAMPGNYYTLNYAYNVAGQTTQVNYTAHTTAGGIPISHFSKNVNYAYNTVGALGGIGTDMIGSNPNATTNVVSSATFRATGALNVLTYGNGRRLTMGYDPLRPQPTSMKVDKVSDPTNKVLDYEYDYNDLTTGKNNNRIRKITDKLDPDYTTTYTYDAYNRLKDANWTGAGRLYQYDEWGNIKSINFGLTYHYATNASGAPATNRLDSVALNGVTQTTFSYDAAGNTVSGEGKTFAYDAVNRLKSVNGGASTYGYDGNGKRVRVTNGGAAVYYVHSSALKNVAMEVTSTGVQRAYVYAGSNKLVAMQATDGQFYWLHTNHLNSSRAMTDVNGNLTYKGQFDPFGQTFNEWSSSGNNNLNSKKFTGYERDTATGLDYAQARMYNSGRGRFMTPDPMGLRAASKQRPQSLNRYSYVSNDPVNFLDPGGTCLVYWSQVSETYGFWDSVLCRDSWALPMPEMPPSEGGVGGVQLNEPDWKGLLTKRLSNQKCKDFTDKAFKNLGITGSIMDAYASVRPVVYAQAYDEDGNKAAGSYDEKNRIVTISPIDPLPSNVPNAEGFNRDREYRLSITLMHELFHYSNNPQSAGFNNHLVMRNEAYKALDNEGKATFKDEFDKSSPTEASGLFNKMLKYSCPDT